jgi:RHS repeat-associated protein
LLFLHTARSASPPKRCLRSLFRFIFPAIPEIRGYPMLAAGLGNVPTPQTFLQNFPLLFWTAFHLRFATHAASSFGGPYPTLGRRSVFEGCSTNAYDGDGRRVAKVGSKLYWYGANNELLAETNPSGAIINEYVYFRGKTIALLPSGSTAQFYIGDTLGTSRIVTTNTGVVCYDADFTPFGGERSVTSSCAQNNYKFEGKERDVETGNDDFDARSYNNRFGRFLSADWSAYPEPVPYADLTNPQTLNLYSMVQNDPESFTDLDGHEAEPDPDPQQPKPAGQCISLWCKLKIWLGGNGSDNSPPESIGAGPSLRPSGTPTSHSTKQNAAKAAAIPLVVCNVLEPCGAIADTVIGIALVSAGAYLIWDNLHQQYQKAPAYPPDPTKAPGPDWVWRGKGAPGSKDGSWYNPKTGESLHPDLQHPDPIGPHWDYRDPNKNDWRIFPDGRVEPK